MGTGLRLLQIVGTAVALSVVSASTAANAADPSQYQIANRIQVEGAGGGDLLAADEAGGRVFVSHMTQVAVIDTKTGKQIGAIPDTQGVHGIALAPDLNKGFITCAHGNTVAVFSLDTLKETARVQTGTNPDAIAYEPSSHRVFAFNGRSGDVTVIDAKTNAVVGTIALDGKPELTATDGKGTVFVNLEDKSVVLMIDANSLKVKARWPLAPGEEPTGLALDPVTNRLFAGCNNNMMIVLDAQTGKVVANLPVGGHVDGVAFDPAMKRAYSSNGDGTLTVVEETGPDNFKVIENVATHAGAKTLAVDTKTHHIFLPFLDSGAFVVLDIKVVNSPA